MAITYEEQDEELARIPKEGTIVVESNQPLGGIDANNMIKILTELRPDFKNKSNLLLKKKEPLS
ncbi:GNAT family N-acetyltransferase [Ornithobacterium rhinotracheale]